MTYLPEDLEHKIDSARRRMDRLVNRSVAKPDDRTLFLETFEELSSSLEELHVAAEQLREQSERTVSTAVHQAVEREARRFEALFDLAPDGYLVTSADAMIRMANRAAATLLGVPSRLLAGKPLGIYVAGAHRASFLSQLESLQQGAEVATWEVCLQGRARGLTFAALTVAPRVQAGVVEELLWIVHDITPRKREEVERRKFESRVEQAQRLESLGLLAGGIAHDFNNLLTGILGNAGLALETLPPSHPLRTSIEEIESAALRAADLTQQLLAYSGRGRFMTMRINLSRTVEEMGTLLRTVISKRAAIEFAFTPDLPSFEGDPGQISQIVMNLITNASEAMGERGGTIRVATGVVHADRAMLSSMHVNDDAQEGDYVSLEVSDTGIGMDDATVARMFDPFFSTKATGRGLGLSAVLGIVTGHRAALRVTSTPGKGTSLLLLFPCAATPLPDVVRAPDEVARWTGAGAGTGTVLVVEDEATVRSLSHRVLEKAGFKVLLAAHGSEGLELFGRHREEIAAVVVDLTMPRMSGVEVLEEIRRQRPEVPALLMSGFDESEAASRFRGEPNFLFLQKPFRAGELLASLARLMNL